jgi:hypothetical protein
MRGLRAGTPAVIRDESWVLNYHTNATADKVLLTAATAYQRQFENLRPQYPHCQQRAHEEITTRTNRT